MREERRNFVYKRRKAKWEKYLPCPLEEREDVRGCVQCKRMRGDADREGEIVRGQLFYRYSYLGDATRGGEIVPIACLLLMSLPSDAWARTPDLH